MTLEVRDGMILAPPERNLRTGTDTAIVTTSRGYARRTPVTITTAGILCDLGDGRQRALDVLGLDQHTGFSYPGYQSVGFRNGISHRATAPLEGIVIAGGQWWRERRLNGQSFGFIDQAEGCQPLDSRGAVSREAQTWAIIKYGRKVGHNSAGYPDNQS